MDHDDDYLEECWVCQQEFPPGTGIAPDDQMEICCRSCWDMIPGHWRLMLCWLFREADSGGVGLKTAFLEAVAKLQREWPGAPGRN